MNTDYEVIIKKLSELVLFEEKQPKEHQFGVMLSHWKNPSDAITIDSGALKAIIRYYSRKK